MIDNLEKFDEKKLIFVISKVKRVKNWTKEEDDILLRAAEQYEYKNWNTVAKHLKGRSSIQCSARYKRIKPGIMKGAWTEEEDEELLKLIQRFGKNWSLISKYIQHRSGKQIRDRFLNALDPNLLKEKFTPEEDKQILRIYAKLGSAWTKIANHLPGRTGDMIKNRFYSSLRKKIHTDDYRESLRKRKTGGKNIIKKVAHQNVISPEQTQLLDNIFKPLKQEKNVQNYDTTDNQMAEITNKLVYQNYTSDFSNHPADNNSRKSIENQIQLLKELLNFTQTKLDLLRKDNDKKYEAHNILFY